MIIEQAQACRYAPVRRPTTSARPSPEPAVLRADFGAEEAVGSAVAVASGNARPVIGDHDLNHLAFGSRRK